MMNTATTTRYQVETTAAGSNAWNQVRPVLDRVEFATAIARALRDLDAAAGAAKEYRILKMEVTVIPVDFGNGIKADIPQRRGGAEEAPKKKSRVKAGRPPRVGPVVAIAGSLRARCMEIAASLPAVFGVGDILAKLEEPRPTPKRVSDVMTHMKAQGKVFTAGYGKYSLSPSALEGDGGTVTGTTCTIPRNTTRIKLAIHETNVLRALKVVMEPRAGQQLTRDEMVALLKIEDPDLDIPEGGMAMAITALRNSNKLELLAKPTPESAAVYLVH
jgi:hypothetical protein